MQARVDVGQGLGCVLGFCTDPGFLLRTGACFAIAAKLTYCASV